MAQLQTAGGTILSLRKENMVNTSITFNITFAVKYGIDATIMFEYIHWWVKHNKKRGQNFYEGKYWIYNSYEKLSNRFPFWSVMQIRRIINKLKNQGLIITGKFNAAPWDHTTWYTISDKGYEEYSAAKKKSDEKEQSDCSNEHNSAVENNSHHVFKSTDQYQDNNSTTTKIIREGSTSPSGQLASPQNRKRFIPPTQEEVQAYCDENGYDIDATMFWNYYESKGWVVGKNSPVKNWKSCVVTWMKHQKDFKPNTRDEEARKGIKWID